MLKKILSCSPPSFKAHDDFRTSYLPQYLGSHPRITRSPITRLTEPKGCHYDVIWNHVSTTKERKFLPAWLQAFTVV